MVPNGQVRFSAICWQFSFLQGDLVTIVINGVITVIKWPKNTWVTGFVYTLFRGVIIPVGRGRTFCTQDSNDHEDYICCGVFSSISVYQMTLSTEIIV